MPAWPQVSRLNYQRATDATRMHRDTPEAIIPTDAIGPARGDSGSEKSRGLETGLADGGSPVDGGGQRSLDRPGLGRRPVSGGCPRSSLRSSGSSATGAGPVKEFCAPRTSTVRIHTAAEWKDPQAVGTLPRRGLPRLPRLCGGDGSTWPGVRTARGRRFSASIREPGATAESSRWRATGLAIFRFPILLDPARSGRASGGRRVTPEAVVVLPDGQVIYRGRIDDRYAAGGRSGRGPTARPGGRPRGHPGGRDAGRHRPRPLWQPDGDSRPRATSPDETITFTKHVAPILWQNCARCHRPGEVGPFPLLSYRDAARRADFIREVTARRSDAAVEGASGCRRVPRRTSAFGLEKEILARWAETGCAGGRSGRLAAAAAVLRRLGTRAAGPRPDDARALDSRPAETTSYRAFALPLPLDHDVTISGVEFRPGQPPDRASQPDPPGRDRRRTPARSGRPEARLRRLDGSAR